ncbi:MAG: hypothetical protein AAF721_23670 [Myxococcota bacterium]
MAAVRVFAVALAASGVASGVASGLACNPAPTPKPTTAPLPIAAEPEAAAPRAWVPLVERRLARSRLILGRDEAGFGVLFIAPDGAAPQPIRCDDRLQGAWGLWVDDVDGDGNAEAIVALHKPARFDETLANRLHVYSFEGDRCVPAWRGTRLAGRFDAARTDPEDRGALLVHEWLSPTRRRIARYRWQGFGYRVEEVTWTGTSAPPPALTADFDFGPPVGQGR